MTETMNKLLFAYLLALISTTSHAQMDIDQADSLDFEAFHTEKETAIKLPGENENQPKQPVAEKRYTDPGSDPSSQQTNPVNKPKAASNPTSEKSNSGKFFEIRAQYTPAAPNQVRPNKATNHSAANAIDILHQQMVQLCPQGWTKLGEKSLPVESEFYLYYEFRCF